VQSLIDQFDLPVTRRTMNNYTLEMNVTSKSTRKRKYEPLTDSEVEEFLESTNHFEPHQIYVFDEKNFESNRIPRRGLAPKGRVPFIHVSKEIFPERVDLLHGCSIDGFLGEPLILTPSWRKQAGVSGFRKEMVNWWLYDIFCPAIEKKNVRHSVLMFDKSTAHQSQEIRDIFEDRCPETFGEILVQPSAAAKFVSPLDNGAHSVMESAFRSLLHLTDFSVEAMLECIEIVYNEIDPKAFGQYYRKCQIGLWK